MGRHIRFQLVFLAPEQLETPSVPDHGVEGREEAQPVGDLVVRGHGVLGSRPQPKHAVDLSMGVAGFGVLLDLPHLGGYVRHSIAQQSAQIAQAARRQGGDPRQLDLPRLASPVTVSRFLPFDVRRCLSILAQGRYLGACQMRVAGLED